MLVDQTETGLKFKFIRKQVDHPRTTKVVKGFIVACPSRKALLEALPYHGVSHTSAPRAVLPRLYKYHLPLA